MSLIEQAAKRLEQLRQAGVELPEEITSPAPLRHDGRNVDQDAVVIAPKAKKAATVSRRVELKLDALAASGLLVPQASRSLLADEFRVIKRPLIANAMGKGSEPIANGNLIMITSALPGEGKSSTAINLAISIAMELDNTVMLVDADVARPSILRMLGLPPAPGLLDVVNKNSVDISGVLLRTNIEKLSILPSGTQHERATELLASDAMVRLLDDMASRYNDRIIIFDSPPLLITTEAPALAAHMGQIVIVVQAENTTQATVKQAVDSIEACPLKMVILNQVRQASSDGYGYGYGYGYRHEKK
ncbi:MAG: XrtA-associated tyrosine autokinase [Betaproteobacteria bacterium]|nr:XrtA-associated tyrosine autokinase [Betaproteobacteria bacterium]MCL2885707.1 XrtA-associated tyrosine autokinase [Betaproteobacteria bacterium]